MEGNGAHLLYFMLGNGLTLAPVPVKIKIAVTVINTLIKQLSAAEMIYIFICF